MSSVRVELYDSWIAIGAYHTLCMFWPDVGIVIFFIGWDLIVYCYSLVVDKSVSLSDVSQGLENCNRSETALKQD